MCLVEEGHVEEQTSCQERQHSFQHGVAHPHKRTLFSLSLVDPDAKTKREQDIQDPEQSVAYSTPHRERHDLIRKSICLNKSIRLINNNRLASVDVMLKCKDTPVLFDSHSTLLLICTCVNGKSIASLLGRNTIRLVYQMNSVRIDVP